MMVAAARPPRLRLSSSWGDTMPVAKVRGVNIFYQVIGNQGPWVALITGGRRGHDEFVPLATKLSTAGYRVVLHDRRNTLSTAGYRVVLHDRRNTGRSDVLIAGDVAEEILWLDDLHELLKQLNAVPTILGGSSAGARTAMRYYTRFPNETRALLLMRVTGGAFAAGWDQAGLRRGDLGDADAVRAAVTASVEVAALSCTRSSRRSSGTCSRRRCAP